MCSASHHLHAARVPWFKLDSCVPSIWSFSRSFATTIRPFRLCRDGHTVRTVEFHNRQNIDRWHFPIPDREQRAVSFERLILVSWKRNMWMDRAFFWCTNGQDVDQDRFSQTPGCTAFTVTCVPFNRFAISCVNRIFANLLCEYALYLLYDFSLFKSFRLISPYLCARLDKTIMRAGADAFRMSNSKLVNKKWPKWLTPNCISKPSLVIALGIAITPALLIKMSRRFSSCKNLKRIGLDAVKLKSSRNNRSDCIAYFVTNFRTESNDAKSNSRLKTLWFFVSAMISCRVISHRL